MTVIADYNSTIDILNTATHYRMSTGDVHAITTTDTCPSCGGVARVNTDGNTFATFSRHHIQCLKAAWTIGSW